MLVMSSLLRKGFRIQPTVRGYPRAQSGYPQQPLMFSTECSRCIPQNFFASSLHNPQMPRVMIRIVRRSHFSKIPVHRHFRNFSSSTRNTERPDPFARRPNKVCDPYGQDGKPLNLSDAERLLATLENGWKLETIDDAAHHYEKQDQTQPPPRVLSLYREFYHFNFITGSKFGSIVAAVAHNNNHYPSIILERKLLKGKGAWQVVTTVKCETLTLQGLSHHDFHVAMMIDVEVSRQEVQQLLLSEMDSQRKHT